MKKEYEEIRGDRYYKQMNYEGALVSQVNRISDAVSRYNKQGIIHGIISLTYMLPKKRREKALAYIKDKGLTIHSTSNEQIELWMSVLAFCNDQLQESNLIFREGKGPSEYGVL
jgi:hypothetical protein